MVTHMKKLNEARKMHNFKNVWTTFWFKVFIYWVVRELLLTNDTWAINIIKFSIPLFTFSKHKHISQNYYKKVPLDFNFNCHGNKKLNQNNRCNKL